MTPDELKHMRTILRVIQKMADEKNQREIAKIADEGLRLVNKFARDRRSARLVKIIPIDEIPDPT